MLRRYFGAFGDLRHLPRGTWYVCVATFVNRAGTMVLPFLTLYLTSERGLDPRTAGLLVGCYGIGGLCAGPASGYLCDRFGAARVARLSLVAVFLLLCVIPWLEPLWALAAGVFLYSISNETFRPASIVLARENVPAERVRQAYGAHRLAVNLGFSIGPAVGGFIVAYSFDSIFYVNAIAVLLTAVLVHHGFFHRAGATASTPRDVSESERVRPSAIFEAMKDRRMAWFALALFPTTVVFFQYESTLPLFMTKDLGLTEKHYGLLFTINTLLVVALELPLLAATQRFSHRAVLLAGAAFTALGFGILAVVTGFAGTLVSIFFWTIGEIFLFPQAQAYVTELAPRSREGTYTGILTTVYNLGLTLGPPGGLAMYQSFGARAPWLGCLFAGAVSMVLIWEIRDVSRESRRIVAT
jgi:predicted MFS family arabinose efflux permease